MLTAYTIFVLTLTTLLAAITILPETDLQEWWIRAMDFPRIQILVAAIAIAILCLFVLPGVRAAALIVTLVCAGFQGWKIFPYTPLAQEEVRLAPPDNEQIKFLAANVLLKNRDYHAVAALIQREKPDVIFLMETDQRWVDALKPALEEYETVIEHPQDNHYGLIFATKLETVKTHLLDLGDADKPTLYAALKDRKRRVFHFVGLHPPPPVPGHDTEVRDAKIAYAARFARESGIPVVIMGDFNEAAWSHMAQDFKRYGGYLDPRVGRGPLPSFDATHPILRYPIDQFYVTPDVAVVSFTRGEKIGSDHFPMLATVRIDPGLAAQLNRKPAELEPDEAAEVERMVNQYGATLELDIRESSGER